MFAEHDGGVIDYPVVCGNKSPELARASAPSHLDPPEQEACRGEGTCPAAPWN